MKACLSIAILFSLALTAPLSAQPSTARDVKSFGAVGDGVADDTAALQRAVDEAGSVWLSAGVYRIQRPIEWRLAAEGFGAIRGDGSARIEMAGQGPAIRITGSHQGTAAPKTVKLSTWDKERMPIIGGFEIVGRHAQADGVWASGAMQLIVRELNVRDARHALRLHDRNRNVIVSDCHFYDNSGVGLLLDEVNLHQINVGNSHISYNDLGGVVVRGGNVRNLQVHGCDIEGNMGEKSKGSCNVLLESRDGSIAEVAIVGCTIQHTRQAEDSANIRVLGSGVRRRDGKNFAASFGNIAIANNVLSDVQFNIDLHHVRGVTITGNTIWKGFRNSIRVRNSSQVVIGSNVVDRNPQYQDLNGSRDQVLIDQCDGVQIKGLSVKGVRDVDAAVLIRSSSRINVDGLSVLDSDGVQLQLIDVHDSRVSDSLLSDRRDAATSPGLQSLRGKNLMLIDNLVTGAIKASGENVVDRGNVQLSR